MSKLSSFKAVIFDFDDTILATFKVRSASLIEAATYFQFPLTIETVREHWGKPFRSLIASILPAISYDEFFPYYRQVMLRQPPQLTLGVRELLEDLQLRSTTMIIISSSASQLIWQDLENAGIAAYFTFIQGSDNTEFCKPDPRVLHPALARLLQAGVKLEEIVMIGDSVRDFIVASANGLSFIAVTSGIENREMFLQAAPNEDKIISSLLDLL